ncbi:MAG: efflux RND transporter permease subunit [Gammaproteobacteria bacterium]|nr:efflux RND transporter permease subunit [Gammaproteobacteria bacterium]
MRFTDIFIQRPVLSIVISLLIAVLGIMAYVKLPLQEFPEVNLSNVSIYSSFPGATAQAMQSMVTGYIEDAVASVDGVDYIESSSSNGSSTVVVHLLPGTDVNAAIAEITTKIQQTKGNLPSDPSFETPQISKGNDNVGGGLMFIAFYSDSMTTEQISDYLSRVVSTKLQAIDGVAGAGSQGGRTYAMRIWLDPKLMAAKQVTGDEVKTALTSNNVISGAGYLEGKWNLVNIEAQAGLSSVNEFNNMVVRKAANGTLVRIRDVGYAQLGATSYSQVVLANGKPAVVIKITTKAGANPLTVAQDVKKVLPDIIATLPTTMKAQIVYDQSRFIGEAVHTVIETLIEAALIVVVIIFLCLGSMRAVFIPVVTIPLSLIGVCAVMLALHFSLNILTLLALVLAIGLVVDDAIVVSENITRHLEHGVPPLRAAIMGAREIASPVITMSLTLFAVFLPVGLAGGLTGVLFSEFSYTLAGTVIVSAIISLTLSPMMCSRVLSLQQLQQPFVRRVDGVFERLKNGYQQLLTVILKDRIVIVVAAGAIFVSCIILFATTTSELAPTEDQGTIFANLEAPTNANIKFTNQYTAQVEAILEKVPERESTFVLTNRNSGEFFMLLKPRDERHRTAQQIESGVYQELAKIPGLLIHAVDIPTLPGGGFGSALEFALTTPNPDPEVLFQVSQELERRAKASHMFKDLNIQMKLDTPLWEVNIDRSKAAQMGITSQQIINALNEMLGGGKINYFAMAGRNYNVIQQAMDQYRMTPEILKTMNIATDAGVMVPLGNFIHLSQVVKPTSLQHFQRLNSTFVWASMADGYSLSDGLNFMIKTAKQIMPSGMTYNVAGQARQMVQEGNRMLYTFLFALIIIFLVLAAQFESFRDPLIIMISVPLSLFGALIPLNMGFGTINLFTEIGFLTLIGLISKHGILIVQFANKLQETEGLSVKEAVIKAASLRLRPILMTTAAMIFGVTPLLFSKIGLANSQHDIALVIFFGMLIGTLFTLFVVPSLYTYLAHKRSPR